MLPANALTMRVLISFVEPLGTTPTATNLPSGEGVMSVSERCTLEPGRSASSCGSSKSRRIAPPRASATIRRASFALAGRSSAYKWSPHVCNSLRSDCRAPRDSDKGRPPYGRSTRRSRGWRNGRRRRRPAGQCCHYEECAYASYHDRPTLSHLWLSSQRSDLSST